MKERDYLGEFEQLVLLAILRLRGNGYGVSILQEIHKRTGRTVSVGALYTTLDRLQEKGYVSSWIGDPTPLRGGRAKRFFKIEAAGARALRASHKVLERMSEGLQPNLGRI